MKTNEKIFTKNNEFIKSNKYKWFIYCFLIIIAIVSFIFVGFQYSDYGFIIFWNNLKKIFVFTNYSIEYPSFSLWDISFFYLWNTLKIVFIGTSIGFICAIITATIGNKNLFEIKALWIFNVFIIMLRCFPSIILITFFSNSFSKETVLLLITFWFSWLWLHKYFLDSYSNVNYYGYNILIQQGNNKLMAIIKYVWYKMINKFVSLFLYSLESNIRYVSLISAIGFFGIGELIVFLINNGEYNSLGIPIFSSVIFLCLIELVSFILNKYIFLNQNESKQNIIKTIKIIVLTIFIVFILYSCISVNWNNSLTNIDNSIFIGLFKPNFTILNEYNNIGFDFLLLVFQSITILVISFIFALIFIFLNSYRLIKYFSIIGITINTFIRNIPITALFFLLDPLYTNSISTICIVLSIYSTSIIVKNVSESIDNLSIYEINYYKSQGYNIIQIYTKYIWNKFKHYLLLETMFSFENNFRDLIIFGSYGSSAIGHYINIYLSKGQYANASAFVWIAFIILIIICLITFITLNCVKIKQYSEIYKKKLINFFHNR